MPESTKQLTGLKKRQQIASANKMIFVWVIMASVAVSFCGVTMQFLIQEALSNQTVISAKLQTQGTLADNIKNVDELKKGVDALLADTKLSSVKANEGDSNLKVVLDALPTTNDQSALGASLQQVILPKSGVDTSDLTTITQGAAQASDAAASTGDGSSAPMATFAFGATGDYARIKLMLSDLERTIRPMNVQLLALQSVDGQLKATISGVTYYSPSQTVQLGKKTL